MSPSARRPGVFFFVRAWLLLATGAALLLPASAATGSAQALIGPAPAWVKPVAADLSASLPADQLSQGVYYLLSDQQVRVDGADRQGFRHYAMKAVNEKGVEQIANVEVRFDPSFQTLTLHSIVLRRGGRTMSKLSAGAVRILQREKELDLLVFDGSKTANVFLDDVRVGDIVEYAYTLQGSNPVFGGRHFGQFDLQWGIPLHQLYARLLWPSGRSLKITPLNTKQQPELHEREGMLEFEWRGRNVAGLPSSNETPAWYDPYPAVQWGEFSTWAAVAQWAVPLYRLPATLDGELRAAVDRIAREAKSPAERLGMTLRFVQQNIRYMGVEVGTGSHAPTAPATVLARRFGDCKDKTLLTLAMLQALGIEARAALVNTQSQRGVADQAASPGAFNHVLVRARLDGQDYWLDPTRSPQKGNLEALAQASYGQALIVDAATRDLQPMPQTAATLNKRRIRVEIDSTAGLDKPVRYTVKTVFEGASADAQRSNLAGANAEVLQKSYLNYYAQSYPGTSVVERFAVSDDEAANRLTITEQYLITDFWAHSDENKRLEAQVRVPELKSYLQAPRDAIRQAPLAVRHAYDVEHVTELKLPEDWSVTPETLQVKDPAFALERKIAATPRLVTFSDHYRSLADHVSAADTPRYVANLERARDALGYQLYKPDHGARVSQPGWLERINWALALLTLAMGWLWTQLALRVYRHQPAAAAEPETAPAKAIEGWLLLLGLGLLCSPFILISRFWPAFAAMGNASWSALTVPGGAAYDALLAPLILAELAVFIGRLVFGVLLIVLFVQRRRSLPMTYIAVGWSGLALTVLDLLAAAAIPAAQAQATAADWRTVLQSLLVLTVWTAYLLRSQRVRATFVQRRGAATGAWLLASPP